ncbi:MAG TPA: nuclear transport factor 2 family protein [Bryobacteraceae bacterium]|jgi:ketosteroid isomerase-like protein|nr:nuclear transport factor 2 family protein [Bryobacteraceae bacterium]
MDESKRENAVAAMRQINQAWLKGRVEDLAPLVHSEIVMFFPDFAGKVQGREDFLAGFRDFCQNATIHEFHEHDQQIDVAGDTAVITFRYEIGLPAFRRRIPGSWPRSVGVPAAGWGVDCRLAGHA